MVQHGSDYLFRRGIKGVRLIKQAQMYLLDLRRTRPIEKELEERLEHLKYFFTESGLPSLSPSRGNCTYSLRLV